MENNRPEKGYINHNTTEFRRIVGQDKCDCHEAEGSHSISETANPFLQQEIEVATVLVGKNWLASVNAMNDVVEATGEVKARFSCLVENMAELVNLSIWKPDPALSPLEM